MIAKNIDNRVSSIVSGNLSNISIDTYSFETIERPKSPRKTCLSQIQYCVVRGLFNPYFSLIALITWGEACCPAIVTAGSPGAKRIKEKARIDTPNSTGINMNNLLVIYHFIYSFLSFLVIFILLYFLTIKMQYEKKVPLQAHFNFTRGRGN